ncbi:MULTISPECIES: erythromycin esterase family protein [Halolamina]|uniref:Erythromycin esterase n=1 Tax=Halolamina pelagica TaxID=699431 RepID=A0A1I5PJS1_9EURY|nr:MULTISPECIES: erythromycin esterase family protein [Halolamina]NHX34857.1 erythromycin esterase family protein [Halolamina sp. R1-12]SFP34382.1 erythromycin esterase [Halolamina pelagica]
MADPSPPIAELRDAVVPLGGTDPETPINAAAADGLRDVFADASLVGLGETSHGARSQFRLKRRLIRFSVEELGVRAFALEVDPNWARQVDAYVADGAGDIGEQLVEARISWPWKTAELVDLFEWMRAFNEDRSADDRIRVYGFDTTSFGRAADALSTFFDAVDADAPGVRDRLATLAGDDDGAAVAASEWLVDTLPPLFEDHGDEWAARCSGREFAFARRQPALLAQAGDLATADAEDRFALRDEAMAANASWIVGDAGADRAVLWGHNVHVARGELSDGMLGFSGRTMGDRLAASRGDDYVPIGIGLGSGEYLAMDAETMGPATPTVPEPPAGSIPDAFSRLDVAAPFVSTAALHERAPIADWLAADTRRHRISGMVEDGESLTYVASDLSEFDGFAFVGTTGPTRHLGLDG